MTGAKDGGPAFPSTRLEREPSGYGFPERITETQVPGMSLRDWFAGQAISAIFADAPIGTTEKQIAADCYAMADAMLAERERTAQPEKVVEPRARYVTMTTVKNYDAKCWELAAYFLEGDPDIAHIATTDRLDKLAIEIQQTVEDFIANALDNYDGASK